jgi:hypothetical protein
MDASIDPVGLREIESVVGKKYGDCLTKKPKTSEPVLITYQERLEEQ